ncbi:MAG: glycosyltransferase family 2 protein [Myxococcota bacterium]
MNRPLLTLLAHNEAASIAGVVQELRAQVPHAEVLVVDDGSTDDTGAVALRAGAVVVRHLVNLGVAGGESTALMYAQRHGHDCVIRMDGDGQHDPGCVQDLLNALSAGADLVVGSRFLGEAGFRSTGVRRVGIALLSGLLTRLCGARVTDPTSGFRGFSPRAVELFSTTYPHDYPEPESVLMAYRRGLRVCEVPVRMRPRRFGKSSLTPLRSALYMAKVFTALSLELLRPRSP